MTLVACDPVTDQRADLALRLESGVPILVSCKTVDASRVLVAARAFAARDSEWVTLLEAEGFGRLDDSLTFGPGNIPSGFHAALQSDATVGPGVTVSVLVVASNTSSNIFTKFEIPQDGIAAESWLRPDGQITTNPCVPS